jgi:predicted DNA-binding transcriptional regulator AlpA
MRPPVILTIADLTAALNRSKSAVRELIDKGEFPEGVPVNGRQVWTEDDITWFRLNVSVRARLKNKE